MADTDYLAASDGTGDAALMHITTPRTALATIIQVDTVAGVPAFFVGTWGTLLASGFIDPTTKRDFFGHVNAGTLVIDKMAPGNTDNGNTSGQVVVIKPSTPVQNLIGNFVKTALNNFGEGNLLNGQIVPSINTSNLTVAIKTLNNVDPSTTDVVYVRIGNAVRSITAPLSVTLAAGTNWFSKGNAPYAAAATDYFVYLGYNATDGVVMGVSSTIGANYYNDFSTTNTDWNYAKISNVAHAAATDKYNAVARFNAILGVSATYLWTLPAGAAQIITNEVRNGAALDIPSVQSFIVPTLVSGKEVAVGKIEISAGVFKTLYFLRWNGTVANSTEFAVDPTYPNGGPTAIIAATAFHAGSAQVPFRSTAGNFIEWSINSTTVRMLFVKDGVGSYSGDALNLNLWYYR